MGMYNAVLDGLKQTKLYSEFGQPKDSAQVCQVRA